MKHIRGISAAPRAASNVDPTPGQILSLIATILSAIGTALLAKEDVS